MKNSFKSAFAALWRGRQNLIIACALAALAIGCASVQSTETLLSAAGFKIIPAATPQQQAHLKTLARDKVTMVERTGTNYFVFPDIKSQVLYVGQDAQYQEYQKLRLQHQMAEDQMQAAELDSEPGWGVWGGFGGVVAVPVLRR
jgi:N-methylhydantoinase A/oxoprolinase/acetone carboxylase beta subunit